MQDVVKINREDNVAVALRPIAKGETLVIGDISVTAAQEIPQGHKVALKPVKAGEVKEISFTQHMNLQGGEYLLSLGVTGYEGDDFTVYHRLYDVLNMTVISDKDAVGFYDPESVVKVI